jgi:hypothetical protein
VVSKRRTHLLTSPTTNDEDKSVNLKLDPVNEPAVPVFS